MIKSLSLIIISFFIATTSLAAKKNKKPKAIKVEASLNEQALTEVNEPVKLKNQAQESTINTGLLNIKTTPIENEISLKAFPVGIAISQVKASGLIKNKKNSELDLSQNSSPMMMNLILNYKQPENKFLSNLALNLGYQQSRQNVQALESVLVSKSSLHLSAYKKIHQSGDINFSALTELGFFQVQVSNSENSLLNAYDKTNFLGLGGNVSHNLTSHLQLNAELTYRKQILTSSQIEIDPIAITVGAAYLW
jgi:hypothetical protein